MKKSIFYILSLVALLFTHSCNDDFLLENKKVMDGEYAEGALILYSPTNKFEAVTIEIPKLQNMDFKVLQYPKFIEFKSFDGHINQSGELTFEIKVGEYHSEINYDPIPLGEIILNVKGFGLLSIPVMSLNHGTPKASISKNFVDFDIDYRYEQIVINNSENGILIYRLFKKPDWLNIRHNYNSENNQMNPDRDYTLHSFSGDYLYLQPDVENLAPGIYEDEVIIATSDPLNPVLKIDVKVRVQTYINPESMIPIEGDVIDAVFNKNNNTLYFITQSPSKLITFDVDKKTIRKKELDRAPYSLTLSADAQTLLLGQSLQMQFIDIKTLETKEKIIRDHIVTSITDGENGFYYFCGNNKNLYAYNLATKEVKSQSFSNEWNMPGGATYVLKVKGKEQLALQNTASYPGGITLVDAAQPDNLKHIKYWHQDFGKKLTVSEDFEYLFSSFRYIFNFPNENTNTDRIIDIGELDTDRNSATCLHHSKTKSTIWISFNKYNQNKYKYEGYLAAYDDKTFDSKYTIKLNDYVATHNNKKDYFGTSAYFIFSTKEENKLVLIKNIDDYPITNPRYWHLETIDIE